jgi:glutamate/aspartate transport system permease protein
MSGFDLGVVREAAPFLLRGLLFSLRLTAVAFLGGLVFGTLIAVARLSPVRTLKALAASYVILVRSIPLVMVIFWFYFLVPWGLGWIVGAGRPIPMDAEQTAYVTFTLFEMAYYAEIIRAGITSVPNGQEAAAVALGLSRFQTYWLIVLPQAVRNMLPIILTQTLILFQDTSLVYVISITDLVGAAAKIGQRDGRIVEMYLTVGLIFFVICFLTSQMIDFMKIRTRGLQ